MHWYAAKLNNATTEYSYESILHEIYDNLQLVSVALTTKCSTLRDVNFRTKNMIDLQLQKKIRYIQATKPEYIELLWEASTSIKSPSIAGTACLYNFFSIFEKW